MAAAQRLRALRGERLPIFGILSTRIARPELQALPELPHGVLVQVGDINAAVARNL